MTIDQAALDVLFRNARSQNGWLPQPVSDDKLRELYALMKLAPTSANSSPARFLFLRTEAAKRRLEPFMSEANRTKTTSAPVVAIVGYDTAFYEHLPRLFAHNQDAINWFKGPDKKAVADITAFRNGSLQGGYFILAARAVGLDCGPMSGFDVAGVDREFWAGTTVKTNFICSLGRGDPAKVYPRNARLAFEEACRLL